MKEALFYSQLDNKKVRCDLCHHHCVIDNKKHGICGARLNDDGKLRSLVYGFPAALNIDPIEKKPFFHFMPGSFTYSLGTFGCNFSCLNCLNHDMSQEKRMEKAQEKMIYVSPERIVEDAMGNDCASIAYTYNEPTIFGEYALDVMKIAHTNGLKNVWVSNGYMEDKLIDAILPYLDAINIDLKSFDSNFYSSNCGASLNPVLENLKRFKREQVHLEITTLVIPTISDDMDMLSDIANFISDELDMDTPWHLSRFSPEISWKLKNLPATREDVVYQACEIAKNAGLQYIYTGNIPGDQRENTYCPKCGELLIRRMSYDIERLDSSGCCFQCDRNIDIIE